MAVKRKWPSTDLSEWASGPDKKILRSSPKSSPQSSPNLSPNLSPNCPISPFEPRQTIYPHAKGFQKTRGHACQQYRIPWSSRMTNKLPQGTNSQMTYYKSASYQPLMSIPAFVNWHEEYHGPGCPVDHYVACHIRKIYTLIYPDCQDELDPVDQRQRIKNYGESRSAFSRP